MRPSTVIMSLIAMAILGMGSTVVGAMAVSQPPPKQCSKTHQQPFCGPGGGDGGTTTGGTDFSTTGGTDFSTTAGGTDFSTTTGGTDFSTTTGGTDFSTTTGGTTSSDGGTTSSNGGGTTGFPPPPSCGRPNRPPCPPSQNRPR